ncbi:kelch-like protein 10 [Ylistrum balloti]|uniref:kelch-like protein 10 n=1 Tax=Ylistrum balloti TaxID=509963 RepID=UPI002905C945|nr:kelch-like protein 10 [Ylistrum balloti]
MNEMEDMDHIGQHLQMNDMRKKGLFTDGLIHIPAENVSLPIHKAIMASCSNYFRSLFTWGMCNREYENDVLITGVSAKTMEAVIDYAYIQSVDIHAGNVEDLIAAADRFHMFGLQKNCTDYLVNELTVENCIGIKMFFDFYSCTNGLKRTNEFISRHFTDIAETSQEYLQMNFENLKEIISNDEIYVSDESEVLSAVLRWIKHDMENRKCHFAELLSVVRLTFVNQSYFDVFLTTTHGIFNQCANSRSILEKAKDLKNRIRSTDSIICDPYENMLRPRVPREVLFVVGGWSSSGVVNSLETFDRYTGRWYDAVSRMPNTRAYHATVPLGSVIYVIGGYDGARYLASVACFCTATQTWENKARMHFQRCYVAGVELKGKIYVFGGFDGRQRHDTVECYDAKSNQWNDVQPMLQCRSDCGATVSGCLIYVAGGFDGTHCLSSVEVYNPSTNHWTMLTNMSVPRSGVSIMAVDGVIFAIGGYDGSIRLRSVEEYKPFRNVWSEVESMNVGRSNFSAILFDQKIYAIGGYDGSVTSSHVECFDSKTKKWSQKCPLKTGRSALSACVVSDMNNAKEFTCLGRDALVTQSPINE